MAVVGIEVLLPVVGVLRCSMARLVARDGSHEGGVPEECCAVVTLQVPHLDLAVGRAREERGAVDVQRAHLVRVRARLRIRNYTRTSPSWPMSM